MPEAAPVTMATFPWKWRGDRARGEPEPESRGVPGRVAAVAERRRVGPPTVAAMAGTTGRCGPLALVGGGEWTAGCDFDAELLAAVGGAEVLVLPTAAAYEHPEKAVATAQAWFAGLGGRCRGLMVLGRADAEDEANAAAGAGQPVRLPRRRLAHAPALGAEGISACGRPCSRRWRDGAVVAGSSAGAMVLTDPMVDPRGGALTVGLGMVEQLAVIPHFGDENAEKVHRSIALAAPGLPVVGRSRAHRPHP